MVIKTDMKVSVEVVVANKKYTFSAVKNTTRKAIIKLSKEQSVKISVSKDGFTSRHTTLKIK